MASKKNSKVIISDIKDTSNIEEQPKLIKVSKSKVKTDEVKPDEVKPDEVKTKKGKAKEVKSDEVKEIKPKKGKSIEDKPEVKPIEDKPEVKPKKGKSKEVKSKEDISLDVKSEVKSEVKFEVKSEVKSDVKSEVKSEVKPKKGKSKEVKVEDKSDESKTNKVSIVEPDKAKSESQEYINEQLEATITQWKHIEIKIDNLILEIKELEQVEIELEQEKNSIIKKLTDLLQKLEKDNNQPQTNEFIFDNKVISSSKNIKKEIIIPDSSDSDTEEDDSESESESEEKQILLPKKMLKNKSTLIKTTKGNTKNFKITKEDDSSESE